MNPVDHRFNFWRTETRRYLEAARSRANDDDCRHHHLLRKYWFDSVLQACGLHIPATPPSFLSSLLYLFASVHGGQAWRSMLHRLWVALRASNRLGRLFMFLAVALRFEIVADFRAASFNPVYPSTLLTNPPISLRKAPSRL
jgi:hypothetical protein